MGILLMYSDAPFYCCLLVTLITPAQVGVSVWVGHKLRLGQNIG